MDERGELQRILDLDKSKTDIRQGIFEDCKVFTETLLQTFDEAGQGIDCQR